MSERIEMFFAKMAALRDEWKMGTANQAEIESKITAAAKQWLTGSGYVVDPNIKMVTVKSTCDFSTEMNKSEPDDADRAFEKLKEEMRKGPGHVDVSDLTDEEPQS